jgi:putative restriction endonuclease
MPTIPETSHRLSASHRKALTWFIERRGQEAPWPEPLDAGTFLVNRPKGIHKPAQWEYTLSVRQTMSSAYPDLEPTFEANGSWNYQYFQEGDDPSRRDDYFTNLGLMACLRDRVPVGILRQVAKEPQSLYKVMGLAWVTEWRSDGYFIFRGLTPDEEIELQGMETASTPSVLLGAGEVRTRILASILQRQGQGRFRSSLLNAYEGRCAITNFDAISALEAAHIDPYSEGGVNDITNGILLRADLHTLFDLNLIAIDPDALTVLISPTLAGTRYEGVAGTPLRVPKVPQSRPNSEALRAHRVRCEF